jgi:hypothetical protein
MTDAELAALEARMIATAPIVLEHVDEPQADGDYPDGSDTDAGQDGDGCAPLRRIRYAARASGRLPPVLPYPVTLPPYVRIQRLAGPH